MAPDPSSSLGDVLAVLDAVLDDGARRARSRGAEIAALWDIAADCLRGGKLVRPRLLLDMAGALADSPGSDPAPAPEIARAAASLELLHYAFLLHDDVIDGDTVRRGRDNLIGVLLRRAAAAREEVAGAGADVRGHAMHAARSAAILMGDLMLTTAHLLLARTAVGEARRVAMLDLLEDATLDTVVGENLDVALAAGIRVPDLATVLDMTGRKTAAYTITLPLRLAAVLAGRPDLDDPLRRAGGHLGLAYQLQDDLLSAFGDPSDHGKDPLGDLREGKQTVLIAVARETAAWEEIGARFGRADITAADGDRLRDLLVACGAKEVVERSIAAETAAARAALAEHSAVPGPARAVLDDLIARLDRRTV